MTLVAPDKARKLAELFENVEALEAAGIGALSAGGSNLPLRRLAIRSRVSGIACQTTIAQVFANPHREFVEATYIFPLPGRFAVTACKMLVGGRVIEAELQERSQARAAYNQAIAAGHRAAIAEEERSETFTLRVGNIPPLEEVSVELTVVGNLSIDHGEATLRIPLVVAPRYVPGQELYGPSVGLGTANDTDEAPDASRVTPPTLLAGCPNPVNLSLEVDLDPSALVAGADWKNSIRSSLHSVFLSETSPVKIKLLPGERLNRDFILRFPVLATALQGAAEYASSKDQKAGVFAVTIYPPADCAKSILPRDVVFVLDRSGSMGGWKIVAARRALARMIDTLGPADRFRVLAFDNSIETPHAKGTDFQIATDRERWQAAEWIAKIDARGGTELGGALRAALQPFAAFGMPAERDAVVVLITDGQVAGEDSVLRTIESLHLRRMPRIFTLGIDRSVNAGLLTRLANLGGGSFELIESEQRLDQVLERVHQQIAAPLLTEVEIKPLDFDLLKDSLTTSGGRHVFADRPLTIFGRCGQDPKSLRLQVVARDASGGTWRQEITAERTNSPLLLPLWGRSRVRELEDQYARSASQALQSQIVATSLESHILSRFTSYVAVDRAEIVNKGGQQQQIVQPVEQPEGWEVDSRAMPAKAMLAAACRSFAAPTQADASAASSLLSSIFGRIGESVQDSSLRARKDLSGTVMRVMSCFATPSAANSAPDADEKKKTKGYFGGDDDAKAKAAAIPPMPNTIPEEVIEQVPESVCRELGVLPVAEKDGKLVVRMSDPNDVDTIEKLRFILNRKIEPQSGSATEINEAINKHYSGIEGESADSVLQEFTDTAIDFTEEAPPPGGHVPEDIDENSLPVIRIVNLLIQEAVQVKASHIVLQPEAERVAVYYLGREPRKKSQPQGVQNEVKLHRRDAPPLRLHVPIVNRICILAKLPLNSDKLQLGQIKITVGDKDLTVYVAHIPTPQGVLIVMRLLGNPPVAPATTKWLELLAPYQYAALAADPQQAPTVAAMLTDDNFVLRQS